MVCIASAVIIRSRPHTQVFSSSPCKRGTNFQMVPPEWLPLITVTIARPPLMPSGRNSSKFAPHQLTIYMLFKRLRTIRVYDDGNI